MHTKENSFFLPHGIDQQSSSRLTHNKLLVVNTMTTLPNSNFLTCNMTSQHCRKTSMDYYAYVHALKSEI